MRRSRPSAEAVRSPIVSGILYPDEGRPLEALVDRLIAGRGSDGKVIAALAPHGALATCGEVMGAVYGRLAGPRAVAVLIGPNHTGEGQPFGIAARGKWRTPLGELEIDEGLAGRIARRAKDLKKDLRCHEQEHSLEVQLPFLQRALRLRRIVPIAIGAVEPEPAARIGEAVAEEVLRSGEKVLVIGTTNLSRYEPLDQANKRDPKALERILGLDPKGLFEGFSAGSLSMCGVGAAMALLAAAARLGAQAGRLVAYRTTAESGGDPVSVAGYAGVVFQ